MAAKILRLLPRAKPIDYFGEEFRDFSASLLRAHFALTFP